MTDPSGETTTACVHADINFDSGGERVSRELGPKQLYNINK